MFVARRAGPWRHACRAVCITGVRSLRAVPCAASLGPAGHVAPQIASHAIVYHPDFQINPIPDGHRFPMPKDHLLYQALCTEGLAARTFTPTPPDAATIALAHQPQYVEAFMSGTLPEAAMRRIGLPWSPALVRRTLIGVGSAVLAARLALQLGVAIMCNGGTHHAHPGHGSGWCIFNDLAIAARAAQRDAGVSRVLLLDLDVHHGDGSAAIFADDPSVYTCSIHCDDQPFPASRPPSDWDIGLPAGTGDDRYLTTLAEALPRVLAAAAPELVLYNAGVDVHGDDALGLLSLTDAGVAERDRLVMAAAAGAGIPLAAAIGGGYAPDHAAIVQRHMHVHRAAAERVPQFAAAADARRAAARTAAATV